MNGVGGLAVIVVLAGFAQLLAKVRGFGSTSDGYPASRKTSPLIGACWLRDCRLECRGCFFQPISRDFGASGDAIVVSSVHRTCAPEKPHPSRRV